ncbi:MAG: HAD family hydrolase, partial [Solirubrobacteraceae bacterium]
MSPSSRGTASTRVDGRRVEVARPRPDDTAPGAATGSEGATLVDVRVDGRPAGSIALADTLRPGAADVVARLRARGLGLLLVTGDEPGPADAVAAAVGIEDVTARVLPQ